MNNTGYQCNISKAKALLNISSVMPSALCGRSTHSAWTGEIGQTIGVTAEDDVQVEKVHVTISNENGILEEGDAIQSEGIFWSYTTSTQVTIDAHTKVLATAQDLARNTAELFWRNV